MCEAKKGKDMGENSQSDEVINETISEEVKEFVSKLDGKRPIGSILIASNGMAAVKFILSIRTWAYEAFRKENAIKLVAMATPDDMRINAEHIRLADQFVHVPGGENKNNYANVQIIVEMAEFTRVSAVWPGWGHASENPELPQALRDKGIIFLGPSAASMAALGDKIRSTLIAQAADVPILPWSGLDVNIPLDSCLVISDDLLQKACVSTIEEAIASCKVIGYPAMIKASGGGGGKGIREVHNDNEVEAQFIQVQDEVPGSPVFVMKSTPRCRHLEVQLICDEHGNVASLHGRDCSVQRRHQKMIEEGPIKEAPRETINKLAEAARRLAKRVNYVGVATVEYLYNMDTDEFYFLELNPRLQVEHPVTEQITKINIPAAHVVVGMGIPLWRIPEIRRFYGKEHGGGYDAWKEISDAATAFDFDTAVPLQPKGHCVAVRITSEDPERGFKPTSGRIQELHFNGKPNVWAYFSIKSGGGIHGLSDSQFGHVFASGESRSSAIDNMVLGLKDLYIRGDIFNNVDYISCLLNDFEYRDNKIYTGWLDARITRSSQASRLDSRIALRSQTKKSPWYLSVIGGALHKVSVKNAAIISDYVAYLDRGQIPPKSLPLVNSSFSFNFDGNKYMIEVIRAGPRSYRLRMNNSEVEVELHTLHDGCFLMQLHGNSHFVYAEDGASGTRLLIDGNTSLLQNDIDLSRLVAETSCKLLRYLVPDRSHVHADNPYAEIEVMKTSMTLQVPASGLIHLIKSEGEALQVGDEIAHLDVDNSSTSGELKPNTERFPNPPPVVSLKVHQRYAASLNAAKMILTGYSHDIDWVVEELRYCLKGPEPSSLPREAIQDRLVETVANRVKCDEGGGVQSLFEEYLSVEELFSNDTQADVINQLRNQYKTDLLKVVDIMLSHQGVQRKNKLILQLMDKFVCADPAPYANQLLRFYFLKQKVYSELAMKAGHLLEQIKPLEHVDKILSELKMITDEHQCCYTSSPRGKCTTYNTMEDLVNSSLFIEDALVAFFVHENPRDHESNIRRCVVEAYIRRLYTVGGIQNLRIEKHQYGIIGAWDFFYDHIQNIYRSEGAASSTAVVESICKRKGGILVTVNNLHHLPSVISDALEEVEHYSSSDVKRVGTSNESSANVIKRNILHIALVGIRNPVNSLQQSGVDNNIKDGINGLAKVLKYESVTRSLCEAGVGIISCIVQRDKEEPPLHCSFNWSEESQLYKEETIPCHLDPPISTFLELEKIKDFGKLRYTLSRDRLWHLYSDSGSNSYPRRMFIRTLIRQLVSHDGYSRGKIYDETISKAQKSLPKASVSLLMSLKAAFKELDMHFRNEAVKFDHVHMYLCILHKQLIEDLVPFASVCKKTDDVKASYLSCARASDEAPSRENDSVTRGLEELAREIHGLVGVQMHQLYVCEWEIKLWIHSGKTSGDATAWRIAVTNVTDHTCIIHVYKEELGKDNRKTYWSVSSAKGPLHGEPVGATYQPLGLVDRKRLIARQCNTTYCYDFPLAFQEALRGIWACKSSNIADWLIVKEIFLSDDKKLIQLDHDRPAALNDVGMVGWFMDISTPPDSRRKILVVANDITFKKGSFGPEEYAFFLAATDLACKKKMPLIYLAANSGARIGMADEVKASFQVHRPQNGYVDIYLTQDDYKHLSSSVIAHEEKFDSNEVGYVIDTIVGKEDDMGVENLSGSGAIASAYSRAYNETFTLTFVTGRTVGIGAYLARLGMRCIQRCDQPIILTGYSALNKLLNREVFDSHMQLGGPKIMAANGVTHMKVKNDLEGVSAILKWLSFIPLEDGSLPIVPSSDSTERHLEYIPGTSCDPHAAISGTYDKNEKWLGGIFDKDSFVETLGDWAKTVVTGRARLGGIPLGIIAVETKTVMHFIPADPEQLDSCEHNVLQAGQVWFPDSANKTAQALLDFNREQLPLFILANWRGFAGGQRDLFEGILQAGSTIVENLRNYNQPVFVYIPKSAELRGGAWVVIDSRINPDHIEMYAEKTAKGNVLEPEAAIEIKFREKELLECMARLDPEIKELKTKLEKEPKNVTCDRKSIKESIEAREKQLLPFYKQIAKRFAGLHDTSSRMLAKDVIKEVVQWEHSRSFFYRRLKRRLAESSMVKFVKEAAGEGVSHKRAMEYINTWFRASQSADAVEGWNDDQAFFDWMANSSNYQNHLRDLRILKVSSSLRRSAMELEAITSFL